MNIIETIKNLFGIKSEMPMQDSSSQNNNINNAAPDINSISMVQKPLENSMVGNLMSTPVISTIEQVPLSQESTIPVDIINTNVANEPEHVCAEGCAH